MVRIQSWVVMAFALYCVVGCLAFAEERTSELGSGELVVPGNWEPVGRVFRGDGRTPAAKLSIKVRNVTENKIVCEGQTDEKGHYRLPKLSPGKYAALYGERVRVNLRVVEGDEPAMELLNVALPSDKGSDVDEIPRPLSSQK